MTQESNQPGLIPLLFEGLKNPFVAFQLGLLIGASLVWAYFVYPMSGWIDKREDALAQWEQINRQEREAIANIKTMSVEELKNWVGTVQEQNVRFAELQKLLHDRERSINSPPVGIFLIAFFTVLIAGALMAYAVRDENYKDSITLRNAIAVLPALKEELLEKKETIAIPNSSPQLLEEQQRLLNLNSAGTTPEDSNVRTGTIADFKAKKGFGFIRLQGGDEQIFFHVTDVNSAHHQSIRKDARVTFLLGKDKQGRDKASNVSII